MQDPVVNIVIPTPQQEFDYIKNILKDLDWYRENDYQVTLPNSHFLHKPILKLHEPKLYELFLTEYDKNLYIEFVEKIKSILPIVQKGIVEYKILTEFFDFKLFTKYNLYLTKYGTGGSYHTKSGSITVMVSNKKSLEDIVGTILHEIFHIGIQKNIIEKFNINHDDKERIVDLCLYTLFRDSILPNYTIQQYGNLILDTIITKESIKFLPEVIKKLYIT